MNLQILKDNLSSFTDFLQQEKPKDLLYLWESQRIFQENWDIEAEDFAVMYDASLQNSETRRLWKGDNFFPKEMMLEFIRLEPAFVAETFKDLFRDENSLDSRIQRFLFHCDEMLQAYKEANPLSIRNNHFHEGDFRMLSAYLSFRFPDRYSIYEHQPFVQTLELLKAKEPPSFYDPQRYFKVCRTIFQFMTKSDELMQAHYARLDPSRHFMGNSLLLSLEFCRYVSALASR